MEPAIRYRKRKQRPSESDPLAGIFTRSRSQIYFHRHRSGYARSDPNRSRYLINSRKGKAKSLIKRKESEARSDQITSQLSVKDLRARRVFSPATVADDVISIGVDVDLEAEFDAHKQNNGNVVSVSESRSDSEPVAVDPSPVRENNGLEADVVVQMTSSIAASEQNKTPVANEIGDTKALINNSQSSVPSFRGRRKVFISPTSINYRRLLPYLMDSENDDSSNFEMVEATVPKSLNSSNSVSDMVALKDEGVDPVSNLNNVESCEKQFSYSVNASLVSIVESSDVVKNSLEDVVNDTLECEQTTPPDSNIYSKSKIDNGSGALVKPSSKLALKTCSRKKVFQTPTSFSHRRLLPFLMSVAEHNSSIGQLKDNQSLKLEKAIEQNQQPPTQSLSHQDEKSTTADDASNSPTSTLVPVDTSIDRTKLDALVSNDNVLDANVPNKESSGSILQLEVNLQGAVKSNSYIKMERSPPKTNLACVEETTINATPLCIVQSYSEDHQIKIKESPQHLVQIPEIQVEHIKNGILKRTPRGCRGICNCLNCTSFRLHAERSFEFSKNQMHDAEEVALELINDLTCLRNFLETTSSYSNSLDTVKEKQVKEACAKALYKEQEARARLAQMNEDLSIHCRSMNLLRPKVTFANKIEEKLISKDMGGKKSV